MWSLLSILFIKKVNGTDSGCTNDDSESDSYGHTCSGWYDANPVDCGVLFDTDNFIANEACCACGGGIALS